RGRDPRLAHGEGPRRRLRPGLRGSRSPRSEGRRRVGALRRRPGRDSVASLSGKRRVRRAVMAVITGKDEQLLIGGEWVAAASEERFDVTNPATGEIVGSMPDGAQEDVQAAIDAAADALESWKSLPAIERARVLR